ncbi:MAG: hypothetical protein ACLFV6_11240 [Spirulinaceae cyanobacterium]
MANRLRNFLIGAGIATAGAIGTKKAVDYFRNRGKEEAPAESEGDVDTEAVSSEEVAYAVVEPSSVQKFLDASFGDPGRYTPTREPKVFDYQNQQYMVIWAYDNKQEKNQMLAFLYTDSGRQMKASVGYTAETTDYNINLNDTPFAVEVNGKKLQSGQSETDGTTEVDFVLA